MFGSLSATIEVLSDVQESFPQVVTECKHSRLRESVSPDTEEL